MALGVGARLGHYIVTAKLREGGMGEVWRATDTQLNRDVALKILPEAFATDPDRLARFQREAQILASLNHPGIAAIYGIEEQDDTRALVLELVEGPTLADRIGKGPIPIDEALPIAKQIAEALEAAHEAGVIHRDLKPANIKVREDGTVKVLDFGLAKAFHPEPTDVSASMSPTISLIAAATQMGMVIGTAAYMAPEQARGKPVDRRADVWAFGCVVYEMLTGRKAFDGEDLTDTLAAIVLGGSPTGARCRTALLGGLRRCSACVSRRIGRSGIRDIGDARLLMGGDFDRAAPQPAAREAAWSRPVPLAIAAGVLLAVGVALGWAMAPEGPRDDRRSVRLSVALPPTDELAYLGMFGGGISQVVVSPDGDTLFYMADRDGVRQIYRRPLDQLRGVPITGTEGASLMFLSPDGESLGFVAAQMLQTMPVAGGDPLVLLEGPSPSWASWGDDGTIVFGGGGFGTVLRRVPATGGDVEPLTVLNPERGDLRHGRPAFLPGGGLLYETIPPKVIARDLDTGDEHVVTDGTFPTYVSTGHLLVVRDTALWAMPFDVDTLEAEGDAVRLFDGIVGVPSVARDGTLTYLEGVRPSTRLVWVDQDGKEENVTGLPTGSYTGFHLSPNGDRVALSRFDTGSEDVFVYDFARETFAQITTDPGRDLYPFWMPDGEAVVFSSTREGTGRNLFRHSADGTGPVERLTTSPLQQSPWGVSADGDRLLLQELRADTGWDVMTTQMGAGTQEPEPLIQTALADLNAAVSPDGSLVAYNSGQQLYVSPFPEVGTSRQQVSGGSIPKWSRDGRTLFFRLGNAVMAASVATAPELTVGIPEVVVEGNDVRFGGRRDWDVAADGRFLMMKEVVNLPTITVVLDWHQELLERVPVN